MAEPITHPTPNQSKEPTADDRRTTPTPTIVCAFERQPEAERFDTMLGQRLEKFGRALSAEKTRGIPFIQYPPAPKTSVGCLGFELRWDKARAGKAPVTRRTARKKLRNSLQRFTQGCRENRNLRRGRLLARLNAKLRGYYNDDGVPGNVAGLKQFFSQALRILKKWRNRRSQRLSSNWAGNNALLVHFNIERPRIVGRPPTRLAASMV
jgi:RNA-directed DNA polymerase